MDVFRRIAAAAAAIATALVCVVALAAAPAAATPVRLRAAPPVVGPSPSATPPRWAIQKTPNPVGAIRGSQLLGVSCPSARVCIAVGFFENNKDLPVAFAERWNGTKWTIQKIPKPAGATSSSLSGVSCTSARACTAVGHYCCNSAVAVVTLAERWNGTTWAIQKTPNPAGASGSFLEGVSCTSSRVCTAVGDYFNSAGTEVTLAERWNATKWTIQKTPNPAGSTSSALSGVSCTSANACTAVGSYSGGALAERWNGTKWAIQKTPSPGSGELLGVSCASASACTAVGDYVDSAFNQQRLVERWNGTTWAIQKTPNPASATFSGLSGVSCTSANACTAIGGYNNTATLAERWDGTKWTIQKTPNPAGATESDLFGVSCTSARVCTAVGDYFARANQLTLAERRS